MLLLVSVNWNITIGIIFSLYFRLNPIYLLLAGAVAMGAHRSSLREDSQVSSAALAIDIINGNGVCFIY